MTYLVISSRQSERARRPVASRQVARASPIANSLPTEKGSRRREFKPAMHEDFSEGLLAGSICRPASSVGGDADLHDAFLVDARHADIFLNTRSSSSRLRSG
jgi:hypothetical protein